MLLEDENKRADFI